MLKTQFVPFNGLGNHVIDAKMNESGLDEKFSCKILGLSIIRLSIIY